MNSREKKKDWKKLEEPSRFVYCKGKKEARTWTALFADLHGKVLHVSWKMVETVPVGHDLDPVQQHVCLVLEEVVLALLEHDHVVLQVHLIRHRVQEEGLEYLVAKRLSTAHKQEGLGAV